MKAKGKTKRYPTNRDKMKTYHVEYHWQGAYGAYETIHWVIFAANEENAKTKALGRIGQSTLNAETETLLVTELSGEEVFQICSKSN